jgi:hypothetical protein
VEVEPAEGTQRKVLMDEILVRNNPRKKFDPETLKELQESIRTKGLAQPLLLEHEVAPKFFAEVVALARGARLLDDEHFTVDGTLIEAWASAKSFRPKAEQDQPPDDNFHGQVRRNDTHPSTTDGDARLMRKGNGKEARLSFGAHALMDGRHGLCADLSVTLATESEPRAAVAMLERQRRLRHKPAARPPTKAITVAVWSTGAANISSHLTSPP